MDSHVERIQSMFRAFEEGGVLGIAEFVDEDMELRPLSGEGRAYRGRDGLAQYLHDLKSRGDELEAQAVGEFVQVGDFVVVPGRTRLRREEGSLIDSQVTWVWRFEGARLAQAVAYPGRLEPAEACRRLTEENA